MSRLERVGPTLTRVLADADRESKAIKSSQLAGSDSVRQQRIFSDGSFDVEYADVTGSNAKFYLVFTPDDTIFNTSLVYRMEVLIDQPDTNTALVYWERLRVASGNVQRWEFRVQGNDATPVSYVRLKFYFWATGNGIFAVEPIA